MSERRRAFRVPAVGLVATLTVIGCLFLFFNLPKEAMLVLPIWTVIGFAIYFLYSRSHSHVGRGIIDVHEDDAGIPPQPVPPMPGAPTPGGEQA